MHTHKVGGIRFVRLFSYQISVSRKRDSQSLLDVIRYKLATLMFVL